MTEKARLDNKGKAVVTGAAGFIGVELCRQLQAAGHSVVRLVHGPDTARQSPGDGVGTTTFRGDIRDRDLLHRALQGAQTVYHLAGIAHVDQVDPSRLVEVNAEGTRAVAEVAAQAGVANVVLFSSSLARAAEAGDKTATDYGRSKLQAEKYLLEVADRSGISAVILRPVNVYGPGMKGNIGAMIRLIRRGLLPPLPALTTRLSLVSVTDLCQAARLAADSCRAAGKTYYVTDGQTYVLNEIEAAIYQALGRQPPGWHSPRWLFYGGAAGAGLLGRLTRRRSSLGLRTYRSLIEDSVYHNEPLGDELGYTPSQTLYTALPALIGVK